MGLPHRDYSVSVGSDPDTETDGVMSPEHAVRLWGRSNTKSGRSSCLSSRANSNLTLTDTEHENTENGRPPPTSARFPGDLMFSFSRLFGYRGMQFQAVLRKRQMSVPPPPNWLNSGDEDFSVFQEPSEITRFACHYRCSTNSQIIALLLMSF